MGVEKSDLKDFIIPMKDEKAMMFATKFWKYLLSHQHLQTIFCSKLFLYEMHLVFNFMYHNKKSFSIDKYEQQTLSNFERVILDMKISSDKDWSELTTNW